MMTTHPLTPFCRCIGSNYLDRSIQFVGADLFFSVEFQNDQKAIAEGIAFDLTAVRAGLDFYYDQVQLESLTIGSGLTTIHAEHDRLLLVAHLPSTATAGLEFPAIVAYCFSLILPREFDDPDIILIDSSYRGTFTVKQPWQ